MSTLNFLWTIRIVIESLKVLQLMIIIEHDNKDEKAFMNDEHLDARLT